MRQNIKDIKTVTITQKGQICIPNVARALDGFKEGSRVSVIVYSDKVELRPLNNVAEMLFPALVTEEVLAKTWNTKEEDEAWKDL